MIHVQFYNTDFNWGEYNVKKISNLVISTFIGPFVMTFFISLFVLLMQFLWKYIDDLAGKGLEWSVIFKLMVYVSVTLVPLALPLAMLLASIMTFGNLSSGKHTISVFLVDNNEQRLTSVASVDINIP